MHNSEFLDFTQRRESDELKDGETGMAYSNMVHMGNSYKTSVRKPERKRLFHKPRPRR